MFMERSRIVLGEGEYTRRYLCKELVPLVLFVFFGLKKLRGAGWNGKNLCSELFSGSTKLLTTTSKMENMIGAAISTVVCRGLRYCNFQFFHRSRENLFSCSRIIRLNEYVIFWTYWIGQNVFTFEIARSPLYRGIVALLSFKFTSDKRGMSGANVKRSVNNDRFCSNYRYLFDVSQ